jgi:hypothetical protein
MGKTISFDEKNNGWTSNWSFEPESYVKIKGDMYTFKKGKLALHNVSSAPINRFYNNNGNYEVFPSYIQTVINQAPSEVKEFKTICVEANVNNFDLLIETNLDSGHINRESFSVREGEHYAFIRRDANSTLNFDLLSIQGIGVPTSFLSNVFSFSNIPNVVSIGDVLCVYSPNTQSYEPVSTVTAYTGNSITIQAPVTPYSYPAGGIVFVAKNPIAESYGVKGVYAKVKLTTESHSTETTLYALNADAVKSYQ